METKTEKSLTLDCEAGDYLITDPAMISKLTCNAEEMTVEALQKALCLDPDVLKQAVNSAALRPNSRMNEFLIDAHLKQATRQLKSVETVKLNEYLKPEVLHQLQTIFPQYTIHGGNKQNGHAPAAATSALLWRYALQRLAIKPSIFRVGDVPDVHLKCPGGKPTKYFNAGYLNVHCCNPIIDDEDSRRFADHMNALSDRPDYRDYNEARDGNLVCNFKGEDCPVQAPKMMIHMVFDMPYTAVCNAMTSANSHECIMTFYFPAASLISSANCGNSGVSPLIGMRWEIYAEKGRRRLACHFEDGSQPYDHDYDDLLALLGVGTVIVSGVRYHFETLLYTHDLVVRRIVRAQTPSDAHDYGTQPTRRIARCFPLIPNHENCSRITFMYYFQSTSSLGLCGLSGMQPVTMIVERSLLERLVTHAMGLADGTFVPRNIQTLASSLQYQTLIIAGSALQKLNMLDAQTSTLLVVAVWQIAYIARHSQTQSLKGFQVVEQLSRSYYEGHLLNRIVQSFKNTFKSILSNSVGPIAGKTSLQSDVEREAMGDWEATLRTPTAMINAGYMPLVRRATVDLQYTTTNVRAVGENEFQPFVTAEVIDPHAEVLEKMAAHVREIMETKDDDKDASETPSVPPNEKASIEDVSVASQPSFAPCAAMMAVETDGSGECGQRMLFNIERSIVSQAVKIDYSRFKKDLRAFRSCASDNYVDVGVVTQYACDRGVCLCLHESTADGILTRTTRINDLDDNPLYHILFKAPAARDVLGVGHWCNLTESLLVTQGTGQHDFQTLTSVRDAFFSGGKSTPRVETADNILRGQLKAKEMLSYVGNARGKKVLDLGAAPGGFALEILAQKPMHYTAVSLANDREGLPYIDKVKNLQGQRNVEFLDIDVLLPDDLPVYAGTYDLVFSDLGCETPQGSTSEEAHIDLLLAALRHGRRALKSGGKMLLKLFSMQNQATIEALVNAITGFTNYGFVKPASSSPFNDEKYLLLDMKNTGSLTVKRNQLSSYLRGIDRHYITLCVEAFGELAKSPDTSIWERWNVICRTLRGGANQSDQQSLPDLSASDSSSAASVSNHSETSSASYVTVGSTKPSDRPIIASILTNQIKAKNFRPRYANKSVTTFAFELANARRQCIGSNVRKMDILISKLPELPVFLQVRAWLEWSAFMKHKPRVGLIFDRLLFNQIVSNTLTNWPPAFDLIEGNRLDFFLDELRFVAGAMRQTILHQRLMWLIERLPLQNDTVLRTVYDVWYLSVVDDILSLDFLNNYEVQKIVPKNKKRSIFNSEFLDDIVAGMRGDLEVGPNVSVRRSTPATGVGVERATIVRRTSGRANGLYAREVTEKRILPDLTGREPLDAVGMVSIATSITSESDCRSLSDVGVDSVGFEPRVPANIYTVVKSDRKRAMLKAMAEELAICNAHVDHATKRCNDFTQVTHAMVRDKNNLGQFAQFKALCDLGMPNDCIQLVVKNDEGVVKNLLDPHTAIEKPMYLFRRGELVAYDTAPAGDYLLTPAISIMPAVKKLALANLWSRVGKSIKEDWRIVSEEGVPGCGKTYTIVSDVKRNELILSSTREGAADIKSAVAKRKDLSKVDVRTVDSYLMDPARGGMARTGNIYVDEYMMVHSGCLAWISVLNPRATVVCYGDGKQIPYIERLQLIARHVKWSLSSNSSYPDGFIKVRNFKAVTRRCPSDVARFLSSVYATKITTISDVVTSLKLTNFINVSNVVQEVDDDTTVLVYTKIEKKEVQTAAQTAQRKVVCLTVHEAQGKTFQRVLLVRTHSLPRNDIYESVPHNIVALSRHTRELVYYYHSEQDTVCDLIRAATLCGSGYGPSARELNADMQMVGTESYNVDDRVYEYVSNFPYMTGPGLKMNLTRYSPCYSDRNNPYSPFTPSEAQAYFDLLIPGAAAADVGMHSKIIAMNPVVVGQFSGKICDIRARTEERLYSYMTPNLRTNAYPLRDKTLGEELHAVAKRNCDVPNMSYDTNADELSDSLLDCFLEKYVDMNPTNQAIMAQSIVCSRENIVKWTIGQGENIFDKIAMDSIAPFKQINLYELSFKRTTKPSFLPSSLTGYPALQTIAAHPKCMNAMFCPIVRAVKEKLTRVLNARTIMFMDLSPDEFAKAMDLRFPTALARKYATLETDISKYDKSQGKTALWFCMKFLRTFGVDPLIVATLEEAGVFTILKSFTTGSKINIDYQRKSGDAMTLLGNTIFNMAVLAFAYRDSEVVFGCFCGDDSVLWGNNLQLDNSEEFFAGVFNLAVKTYRYDYIEFCSKYLVEVEGHWVFFPIPLKVLIKFGRHDVRDDLQLEEYRESLTDLFATRNNIAVFRAVSVAMEERIKAGMDHMVWIARLIATICDKKAFHAFFYWKHDAVKLKDPSRRVLE